MCRAWGVCACSGIARCVARVPRTACTLENYSVHHRCRMRGFEVLNHSVVVNSLIVLCGLVVLCILIRPRLMASVWWRATVTPLASIIGSGFLVVATSYTIS